jgi:signal transduction histidine kinase
MKIFYCLTLFSSIFISNVFSQDTSATIIDITNIPADGLLLNHGWKFQAGDNPEWARNDYNDGTWSSIDPAKDNYELPGISKRDICWLRLHIYSGHSAGQQLEMLLQQSVASEIYVDDSLLYRFGIISENTKEVRAYDPLWKPLRLPILNKGNHVLAIRYQLKPGILYTNTFETINPITWIKMMETNYAVAYYQKRSALIQAVAFISIGFLLMMFILHMTFYLVYRNQKGNLFFGLYALTALTGNILQLVLLMFNHTVDYKFYYGSFALTLFFSTNLFILLAVKYMMELKWDFTYRLSIILFVVAVMVNIFFYPWGWKAGAVITPLLCLNIIRVAIISISKRKRGAWIIAIGGISSIIFFIAFFSKVQGSGTSLFEGYDPLRSVIFLLFALSLPIAASLVLALDFAFANKSLQRKLIEVNTLSQKNIIQEREKQQILASQNSMLEKQVSERTSELKQSLDNLKSTQKQLVQSEKMASLGELTAGIAHEIQNPLNFVNNFSEVNREMIAELKTEMGKGNYDEVKIIADNIESNEAKINQHGRRADAIVKGMLQHSGKSSGQKEPTDLNALCDEYLKLSYHGLRAKDKNFNVTMQTEYDDTIGKINIIAQDIGRVLLNVFNNAFYAVNEKKKTSGVSYNPEVSVITKKETNRVLISVNDNGVGIPANIIDKIFQPFFTTKPAGSGTGLGLSLSYDIIKAHGGEIKVESTEGGGTSFVIQLAI